MIALERYRDLIDDWHAFSACVREPLPVCVWANMLRTTPDALARHLADEGLAAAPVGWYPGAYRLDAAASPGNRLPYLAGLYHVQEEVALLPVALLAPAPGERVADLCAAPGNKSVQAAVAMRNTGTVLANDRSGGRMNVLQATIARLGLLNVLTSVYDARHVPSPNGYFDRVIADVPCTCEGTVRRHPRAAGARHDGEIERMAALQRAILLRAVQLCRPGGLIAYATCTFAPEENEGVVDAALRAADGALHVVPVRTPGVRTAEGLTSWQGASFDASLRHTLRIWPHHNDTGGFYVALLRKEGAAAERPAAAPLATLPGGDVFAYLGSRFGIPDDVWAGLAVTDAGARALFAASAMLEPPPRLQPASVGLPLVRTTMSPPKLTAAAAMQLGRHATRNVIDVDREQARRFLSRRVIAVPAGAVAGCTDGGYVLLRHQGHVLGVGFYYPEAAGGHVASLYPKALALRGAEAATDD